jgi:hypothetical protein
MLCFLKNAAGPVNDVSTGDILEWDVFVRLLL